MADFRDTTGVNTGGRKAVRTVQTGSETKEGDEKGKKKLVIDTDQLLSTAAKSAVSALVTGYVTKKVIERDE